MIPTLAAKFLLLTVAVFAVTFNWSVTEKPCNNLSYNTESAEKLDGRLVSKSELSESWNTDFISSVVYDIISFIEISAVTDLSLIINCSPFIKVPVVWDTAISLEPVESASNAAYPNAPLAYPLILAPCITVDAVKLEHFNIVNVWIS